MALSGPDTTLYSSVFVEAMAIGYPPLVFPLLIVVGGCVEMTAGGAVIDGLGNVIMNCKHLSGDFDLKQR